MLKVGKKKKWYISTKKKVKKWYQLWVKIKTSYNLSLTIYYEIIVKIILKWSYSNLFKLDLNKIYSQNEIFNNLGTKNELFKV